MNLRLGFFYGMGPLLGFTKYNANAVKIDPYWGSIFWLVFNDYW